MPQPSEAPPTFNNLPNSDAPPEPGDDDLNAQVAALLASGAQDTGAPTEAVRLDSLTSNEKRVLLALLRERMGQVPTPPPYPAPEGTARP